MTASNQAGCVMANQPICYIAYDWALPSAAAIGRVLEARRATLPEGMVVEAGETLSLSTPAASVFCMMIDAAYPVTDIPNDLCQRSVWPAWQEESRRWRSHLIVVAMGGSGDARGRKAVAADLLRIVAAIAEGTRASAVAWSGALLFQPAADFAAAVARSPLALEVLVRACWYGAGWERAGIRTMGLAEFDLPEIDHPPTGEAAQDVAVRVLNLAAYLIDQGMVLQDGDTIGDTATASMRVHHAHTPEGALYLRLEPAGG